jgi:hypothetical protein
MHPLKNSLGNGGPCQKIHAGTINVVIAFCEPIVPKKSCGELTNILDAAQIKADVLEKTAQLSPLVAFVSEVREHLKDERSLLLGSHLCISFPN